MSALDMKRYIEDHVEWSFRTFGPPHLRGPEGPIKHIRKELDEVSADPGDPSEWADIIILAIDGAYRAGVPIDVLVHALVSKQETNRKRRWPDWREQNLDDVIEHVKSTICVGRYDLDPKWIREVALADGKVEAVKRVREESGCTLREATRAVTEALGAK